MNAPRIGNLPAGPRDAISDVGDVCVGHLTLVDADVVADSNRNRQLIALCSTVGQPKAETAAARIRDISARLAQFIAESGPAVLAHIEETRELMAQVGARGFPTFVLQTDEGWQVVDLGTYLAHPEAFGAWLRRRTGSAPTPLGGPSLGCDADGCVI